MLYRFTVILNTGIGATFIIKNQHAKTPMGIPLKVFGVFEIIPTGFDGTNVAFRHGVCGKALRAVAPSREVAAGWLRLA